MSLNVLAALAVSVLLLAGCLGDSDDFDLDDAGLDDVPDPSEPTTYAFEGSASRIGII